ncbi:hypothetical protein O181_046205 [Austropuccinia psidii MF-1]|uniref:Uncharacterized protein n=1 Tax=Austropuccinia psidii MF-1 TaxID=1389203 RepID=A0A9Q3DN20_9BASI|nr:hypothetical protein [Austropuccinia psidii MF-1]
MSTHRYSSMPICMFQHCSTQTHSSPDGSECPQILLDQIFPAYYSQLTQSTFSTPPGLTSTAQKPYSRSPNLPPQALGIIISAILSLRYNIPRRDSHILNPSLNLLIKSSISSSGGHPTPVFHIPQYLNTIFENLQLEPMIQNYICCPQCFFLDGLTESVTTYQPHCQCHNDANDHDPPCTQSLGKFINLFEPRTQNTTNIKKKLSQQNISFINHSKIGLADFSSGLELWKFCINIYNPKFPKVPLNVTSGMDCSGDA